ncbi:H+transporting two-sector ATPase B/B' subunit [Marinobacter santoriniensis NKSG1]|uniref:ATP synthase subunit b n=1 Tax=Marinobacter santoriniensis NKSG1 TaxID=1288826 RepID=M7DIG5_9GAMM|nr:H+transporting two-sector ATPase B/B' subunit [Marinobacter santoriniensis]EMP57447.1 H+transporting two-sector ATPase B/B' subunit [Marinobacter santoriniensis NKSG1]
MELSWSTFILEIINFLVLVWVLKHFFYRPVLDVITRRRREVEKTMTDAKALEEQAEQLKQQYEGRVAEWKEERQQARDALSRELETERTRRLKVLQQELEQTRARAQATEESRLAVATRAIEASALEQGARFATRILEQAAGPELESRLIDLFLDQLSQLPDEKLEGLRRQQASEPTRISVITAYPVPEQLRTSLTQSLMAVSGADQPPDFETNPDLIAGIEVTLGAWKLAANVRDELKGFRGFEHHV